MDLVRKMKKALADMLQAEGQTATNRKDSPEAARRKQLAQLHILEQKKAAFEKAQKRVKRERSKKQLRALGLYTEY